MSEDPFPEKQADAANRQEWFAAWFDSPYYHILYKHRDESEARTFIDALLAFLSPPAEARILDLACGKGRYSRYLASKGYQITGLDLSVRSIAYARQFETENLSFFTHDMRLPFRTNYFDFIFNFFTSFGYFDNEHDNIRTLKNAAIGLRTGGTFVLDFFNAQYVVDRLLGKETKTIDGVAFHIFKRQEGEHVIKTIEIQDRDQSYRFEEKVQLLFLPDFERLFRNAGLKITKAFGDYQLRDFDPDKSPRLILVATPV